MSAYPNLKALADGRVSGRVNEWPELVREAQQALRELARLNRRKSSEDRIEPDEFREDGITREEIIECIRDLHNGFGPGEECDPLTCPICAEAAEAEAEEVMRRKPCEYLQEEMKARGWSPDQLAEKSDLSLYATTKLLAGRWRMTPLYAHAIGKAFGTGAHCWLKLQAIEDAAAEAAGEDG